MHSARRFRFLGSVIIACAATMTASQAAAQRAPDYPERPPAAPEQVARGQQLSDRGTPSTLDILVGNAKEGEAYFNGAGHCTQCHSVTGDLAAIGARYEPKTIQNLIVSGGGGRSFGRRSAGAAAPKLPPTTVTVTLPSGQTITGDLDHISVFVVALRTSDGTYRSFARHDAIPKVVVTNPVQWHIDMLPQWRDSDIHNLTAYLVTLK